MDAAFCLFKKTEKSLAFVAEWLKYSCDPRILYKPSGDCAGKEFSDFKESRWDQSILSILAKKYNIELYRMPSQFGNHYKSHSLRKNREFNCLNQLDQRQLNYYSNNSYNNSAYGQLLDHHRSKDTSLLVSIYIRLHSICKKVKSLLTGFKSK